MQEGEIMVDPKIRSIFKGGSKTYFYSSIFFPQPVKDNVFILYSFVRKADDYVDSIPQKEKEYYEFKGRYQEALEGNETGDIVVDSFVRLIEEKNIDTDWIASFLESMEMDLSKREYTSIEETKQYMYGSAEVIGLLMAKVTDLDPASYSAARMLGRAMQYVNFIRDIEEDLELNRIYFPTEEIRDYGLQSLSEGYVRKRKEHFCEFMRAQITRYLEWQKEAEDGFHFIPTRYLIPIKTASDMYKWTAKQIWKNPLIVFERKVKPSIPRITMTIAKNSLMLQNRREPHAMEKIESHLL